MAKELVFKKVKKPQRKAVPFFPSATQKKKKATTLAPVPAKKHEKEVPDPVVKLKKASVLDIQKAKIAKIAKSQKKHGTPTEKKEEMQKAVSINPTLEKSSVAKSNQVEDMALQKTKKFDSKKFSDDILNNIKKVIPKNKEEMEKDQTSSEKMGGAQQTISDSLEKEKQNTSGDLTNSVGATPDQSSVPSKVPSALAKEVVGVYPTVSKSGFAPPLKTAQDNDLSADSSKIDNELSSNAISEEQLQSGNEPAFDNSLVEKKESQKKAAGTHQQYLKLAKPVTATTKSSTNALILGGLSKMSASRNKQLSQVDQNKQLKKQKEEEVRTKVATDLNKIYDDTKLLVESNLKNLDEKVNATFDEALEIANKTFEKNVKERTDTSWYEDLYNWAAGIPNEVKKVFIEEQDNFINSLAPVVRKIGDFVEKELMRATKDIDDGKVKTQNYWKNQSKDTQRIAGDVFTNATAKFTELENKVEEANEGLKQSITTKFNAAVAKLEETFDKIQEENKSWLERAYDAVVGVIKAIIEMKNLLLTVLAKVADVVGKIILDPIGFLSNLLSAIVLGFQNFGKNALEHLKKGFFEWLMGNMPPSIKFPKQWDATGIFEFIMSVFGLTWDNIKARATKMYGATVVAALETGFEIFQIIRKEGIGGLWNFIKGKIGDLKVMVVDAIQTMLIDTVLKAGITWVIGLFNPVGAFIKACKLIYDVISWFINNARRILDLINSIVDSTALIVAGKISQAATFVENSLAKMIPIAIGFLAGLLGLGDLSKKVQALLDKIQAPINKAIDWVLEKAGAVVKTLFKAGKAGVNKLFSWLGLRKEFKGNDGKSHALFFEGKAESPKLMIASDKMTFVEYLKQITDPGEKNEVEKLTVKVNVILNDDLSKLDEPKRVLIVKENENKLNSLLDRISKIAAKYFKNKELPVSKIQFETTSKGGGVMGTKMFAFPLTKNHPDGTESTGDKSNPAYNNIEKRGYKGGSFYVKGHLLNNNLGGPGSWANYTPLPGPIFNTIVHSNKYEQPLKGAIDNEEIFYYKVEAIYGRGKTASIASDSVIIKNIKDSEETTPTALKLDLFKYEFNPDSQSLVKAKSQPPFAGSKSEPITITGDGYYTKNNGIAKKVYTLKGKSLLQLIKIGIDSDVAIKIAERNSKGLTITDYVSQIGCSKDILLNLIKRKNPEYTDISQE